MPEATRQDWRDIAFAHNAKSLLDYNFMNSTTGNIPEEVNQCLRADLIERILKEVCDLEKNPPYMKTCPDMKMQDFPKLES